MAIQVCAGATLTCSFGKAPSSLLVLPVNRVTTGTPAATIMDHMPTVNIAPFAMCTSPSNPTVAAATAAAQGVLTPMPCLPVTTTPWAPGAPTVFIANIKALDNNSKLECTWGGVIQIEAPGQKVMLIP
jgi:hypothetical protein